MSCYGKSEKVRITMGYDWFNGLIETLVDLESRLKDMDEKYPESGWRRDLNDNIELRDKLIKYKKQHEEFVAEYETKKQK